MESVSPITAKTINTKNQEEKVAEEKILNEDLRGIEVKFDYSGHSEEREKMYHYYFKEATAEHPLKKDEIGIFLYDLNNDGKKRI